MFVVLFLGFAICEFFVGNVDARFCSINRETIVTEYQTPVSEIQFNVLKLGSHENTVKDSLESVYNTMDIVVKRGAFLLTTISGFGGILLGVVHTAADKSGVFNSVLAKSIVDTAEKLDLESNINDFKSKMTIIDRSLARIAKNQSIHEDAELADMRRDLEIQIENFDRQVGVYRKYPVLSINSLFVLHAYVLAFDVLFKEKKPHLAEHSQMTCDLNRMLYEYRTLTVKHRLNLIDVSGTYWFAAEKANKIKAKLIPVIAGFHYNAKGYNVANPKSIGCTKIGEIKGTPLPTLMYIKDSDNYYYYDSRAQNNITNCLADYMKYARYEVERIFDKPLSITDIFCSTKSKDSGILEKGSKHLNHKSSFEIVQ